MELKETINIRRSCRNFSNKEIDRKQIEELIECARLSPSAANRQNWYFVILEKEEKNKIANIMEKRLQNTNYIESIEKPTKPYTATSSLIGSIKVIREAPILILVLRTPSDDWLEGDYLSIGSAVEHICLRATDLGLGSLWIRDVIYTRKEIAQVIGYEDMELVVSVAIGKSLDVFYPRRKKDLKKIMCCYQS